MCTAQKEKNGAGLSYTNQGPFFSIINSVFFFFFHYKFFKQKENSLITKILKI